MRAALTCNVSLCKANTQTSHFPNADSTDVQYPQILNAIDAQTIYILTVNKINDIQV